MNYSKKQWPKFYSFDLEDAISLAKASMLDENTMYRADFHAADIAQYNPKHPSIKNVKALGKLYEQFSKKAIKLKRGIK